MLKHKSPDALKVSQICGTCEEEYCHDSFFWKSLKDCCRVPILWCTYSVIRQEYGNGLHGNDLLVFPKNSVIYEIKVDRKRWSRERICNEKYVKQDQCCKNTCSGCMCTFLRTEHS